MIERRVEAEERDATLARRRQERLTDLGPAPRRQLEAGVPILYRVNGEPIEEYPDGSRYIVHLADGGRSTVHLREL